jgi:3-oxoacyl-[acyl-carrier-protein] synthase III
MTFARIAGIGSFLPEKVLTNKDLEKMMDTSDEWIRERTGIKRRHIAAEGETTGSMGLEAARRAIEDAGIDADEIGLHRTRCSRPRHASCKGSSVSRVAPHSMSTRPAAASCMPSTLLIAL